MSLSDTPFLLSTRFVDKKICLAVTGSVAAYKACDLLRAFQKIQIKVNVTLSRGAREFVSPLLFASLGAAKVYGDMFSSLTDPFAHLEPGQNDDAFLIAPASANALANLACGNAAEMYAAQALAFPGPIILAPAMNPRMWQSAAVRANTQTLLDRKCVFALPATGSTACGDAGQGRLAHLTEIFLLLLKALAPQDLAGVKVMLTLGPTRELWDGVRFLSNPSSGRMGVAMATALWLRGADVTAICGPGVQLYLPSEINRINVTSAKEMFAAAVEIWPKVNWGVFTAAVGDFAPLRPQAADQVKIRKTENITCIAVEKNPDILASLAKKRNNAQKILAFAAEICPDPQDLPAQARKKLHSKDADLLAANLVNPQGGAFGADLSSMYVVDKNGIEESWSQQAKADIAWELCTWLSRI